MKRFTPLLLLLMGLFLMTACSKDETDVGNGDVYTGTNTLTGAQETPPVNSSATGTITHSYNTATKTLSYTVTWSGLTGPVAAMHIHAVADPGFAAPPVQNIIASSNGIATPSNSRYGVSGSFTATLFADGFKVKEEDILAGKTYINIHTAQFPNGEIRANLTFNK